MCWFVIFGTILVIYPIAIYMNKRLSLPEIYMTVVFGLFVQTLVDIIANNRFRAWGFFEIKQIEFKTLWIIIGIYPIFAAIFINWFPYRKVWWKKLWYLVAWAAFSTSYEWLALKTGIMWHMHWNLLYSFLLYPFIYYLLIIHVRFYQWINHYTPENNTN